MNSFSSTNPFFLALLSAVEQEHSSFAVVIEQPKSIVLPPISILFEQVDSPSPLPPLPGDLPHVSVIYPPAENCINKRRIETVDLTGDDDRELTPAPKKPLLNKSYLDQPRLNALYHEMKKANEDKLLTAEKMESVQKFKFALDRKLKCPLDYCNYTACKMRPMVRHWDTLHFNSPVFCCLRCHDRFKDVERLSNHINLGNCLRCHPSKPYSMFY